MSAETGVYWFWAHLIWAPKVGEPGRELKENIFLFYQSKNVSNY